MLCYIIDRVVGKSGFTVIHMEKDLQAMIIIIACFITLCFVYSRL